MKKLFLLLPILCIASCGCISTNISELTKALAGDPATVVVSVQTIYGTLKVTRVGEATNSPSSMKTVSPDGTVTIK